MRIPSKRRRRRSGTRRSVATVALDINADAIVALQAGAGTGGRAHRAISYPLPIGLVVDGEVVDPVGLAGELRALFDEHGLPRDVRVGLAHPRLMVRVVELPAGLDGADLDGAVRHMATDLLPVPLDQLVVDHRRIGSAPAGAGDGKQRVLMAAARVDGIERLAEALDGAGLRVQAIGLSGLAMVAALEHLTRPGEAVLYVQAGALTSVVVTEDGQPLLVRSASAGSEAIAAGLAERVGIAHEAARAHVAALGLESAPHHGEPSPVPQELAASVAQQVSEGLRRVVAEVQSSRGVYAARPDARPIGAVVLTGAMTLWPGVVAALEHDLHLPVLAPERASWPARDGLPVAPERLDVVVGLAQASADVRPDMRPATVEPVRDATPLTAVAQVACAMVALLAAAVVYLVVVSNQVSSGRQQLGEIATRLADAERRAAALKPYADFRRATLERRDAIAGVAATRFAWDRTLAQLAEVGPRGVWLTSVKGTLDPSTAVESGADGATAALRGGLPGPALELAGCADREGKVPDYIDRLHAMTGVTDVGFSRSERLERGTGGSRRSRESGGGDCRNGDERAARFSLVTSFAPVAPTSSTAAAAQTASAPIGGTR